MPVSLHPVPVKCSHGMPKFGLFFWAGDGKQPAAEYLNSLRRSRPHEAAKMVKLFRHKVDNGYITNTQHFKDVEGQKPLYEFKVGGIRVYCFFDETRMILVEGYTKQTNKTSAQNRQAIERAERRTEAYWKEKDAGRIEVYE